MIIAEVEQERAEHDNLEDCLSNDIAQHDRCEDRICAGLGLFIEEGISGFLSGKSQGGKGIHQDVDPEEHKGTKGLSSRWANHRGYDDNENGTDIDDKLELKELAHTLEDVAAPLDGGNNGSKVII